MKKSSKRFLTYALALFGGILLSIILIAVGSAISNQNLPTGPEDTGQLTHLDKARLAETLQLRDELGEAVWPGWGKTDIPVILWNRDYSFLIGFGDPPAGWETVSGDDFAGQPYYRQKDDDPKNFAVYVGNRLVASMATKYETDAFMQEVFRKVLPGFIEDVFPYRLLILPSEMQITGVLHESFHVYQAQVAGDKFTQANQYFESDELYWEIESQMREDWEKEIDLLAKALEAKTTEEATNYARQFLTQRDQRRNTQNLDEAFVAYECQVEWLEGLAKYVELAIWKKASTTSAYEPNPEVTRDPDFKSYSTFERQWSQEIDQLKHQSSQTGNTRLYYTGMAQANLLDLLKPDWKNEVMKPGIFLEDLLRTAVAP
jgi:hypothetical protein